MSGHSQQKAAVLFDFDGVLVNSTALYQAAWGEWSNAVGVSEPEIWADAHGRRPEEIIKRVRRGSQLTTDLDLFLSCLAAASADGVIAIPGAAQLLGSLPEEGWAIVTSGPRFCIDRSLEITGLPSPAVLISGEQVHHGKPNPECFQLAADALGVDPCRCTVVEDAPVGIEAARAATMTPIAIATTHTEAELSGAARVFPSLLEASAYLRSALQSPSVSGRSTNWL